MVRVIDGDTVRLANGTLVRYLGVNAPEIRRKVKRKWVYDPKPFSEEATSYNRKLVEGKKVRIEFDPEERDDRYGRLLAYVFVGPVFANEKMIENGLAKLYVIPPHIKYRARLRDAEQKAKAHRLGIWSVAKRRATRRFKKSHRQGGMTQEHSARPQKASFELFNSRRE